MIQRSTSVLALALVAAAALVLGCWLFLVRGNEGPVRAAIEVGAAAPGAVEPAKPGAAMPAPVEEAASEPVAEAEGDEEEQGEERATVEVIDERELVGAIWVEGRVRFPDNTPLGEEIDVLADGKNFKKFASHRVRVQPDGSFRVAFHKDTRNGFLKLDAPHLYLDPPLRVKLGATMKEIVLEPKLGGLVEGTIVPPPGVADGAKLAEGKSVSCWGFSSTGGSSTQRNGKIGPDLRFQLRGIPPHLQLHVNCDLGKWPAADREVNKLDPGETRELAFELHLGARVAGRIEDEQGNAIAKANIFAQADADANEGWGATRQGRVEEDGTFAIEGIEPGRIELYAHVDGYVTRKLELGELRAGDERTDTKVALSLGNSIAGKVSWPDGAPVEGASITITEPKSDDENEFMAFRFAMGAPRKAGADGTFRVTGLGPGPYEVRAEGKRDPGAAQVESEDEAPGGDERAKPVEASSVSKKLTRSKAPTWRAKLVNVAANSETLELVLQRGFVVTGRVTDDTGKPPAKFSVSASRVGENDLFAFGRSEGSVTQKFEGQDGAFVLEGLTEGEWKVSANAAGTTKNEPITVTIPGDDAPLAITLLRTSSIRGIVLDPSGQPAARAVVEAERGESTQQDSIVEASGRTAKTDSKGLFKLKSAPSGTITLTAKLPGNAPSAPLAVDVPPGSDFGPVTLQLRTGSRLTGELLGAPGHTLAERDVQLWRQEGGFNEHAATDASGQFHFDGLLPGHYQVSADASPEEIAKATAEDGDDDWTKRWSLRKSANVEIIDGQNAHVVLGAPPRAPVEISGTVRRGTQPVEGVQIWAYSQSGGQQRGDSTDTAGRYSFTLDEPGEYSFSVQSAKGRTHRSYHHVIPEVAAHTIDFEIPSGRISGRVLGPDGQAFSGAHVALQLESPSAEQRSDGMYGWTRSENDGTYSFEDLPAGTFRVSANDSDRWSRRSESTGTRAGARRNLQLSEGGALTGIDLELSATGSIEGEVRDASGALVGNAEVMACDASGSLDPELSAMSDESGHYRIDAVPVGTWTVFARSASAVSEESGALRVDADSAARANLVLKPATTLVVRVLDAEGQPVGASIRVTDSRGRDLTAGLAWFAESNDPAQGRHVGPLAPGRYTVTASNHDGVRASTTVEVNGESTRDVQLQLGGG
jgi:protocatechuate 3,4-dioxygenase beta subunit